MAVVTIGRLSEEILKVLSGGDIPLATDVTLNEIKLAIGQVANKLLKIDFLQVNMKTGEMIPNGAVVGLYEGITFSAYGNGKSTATLPIKPLKLPRNMGVYSIFKTTDPDKEFIPLQMGQAGLIKSQKLVNGLLGQIGYEVFGDRIEFTQDLTAVMPGETLTMRLVIMDVSLYGDYDILPITPEMEWDIKNEIIGLYSKEPIADKVVDSTTKERKGIPLNQQSQS